MRLNPEIIIDMVSDKKDNTNQEMILNEWKDLKNIYAVNHNQVHIFAEDYVNIPGPRFILILENLARRIHPKVNWK